MNPEDYKDKRRRNLHTKKLYEEGAGDYRLRIKPPPDKGRKRKPLRPVDILNLTEEELDDL